MQAIILAAGYATRLYPLTLNKAKPLLTVGRQPIINYIINELLGVSQIDRIFVVTNNKFYKDFLEWKKKYKFNKKIAIINDKTESDEDKLGAIGDINLVLDEEKLDEDLLVVAGDNLFSFKLERFVDFFKKHGLSIASYEYPYKDELSNFGIVELDRDNRIINFQEKPEFPKTNFVALCIYGFPKEKLGAIKKYIKEGKNKDAPGHYIEWLVQKEKVYSFVFEGTWYDIGTPEAYERARKGKEPCSQPRRGT